MIQPTRRAAESRDVQMSPPSPAGLFYQARRLEATDPRAYISAMPDLNAPEILAWLDTLPLREQLVTLHAMSIAIPALQRSHPLKARIAAAHAALGRTAAQLGDILTAARSQAARLKEELAG
jgi:hypothetical protein